MPDLRHPVRKPLDAGLARPTGKKRRILSIIVVFIFLFIGTLIAFAILVSPYLYSSMERLFHGTSADIGRVQNRHYMDHI